MPSLTCSFKGDVQVFPLNFAQRDSRVYLTSVGSWGAFSYNRLEKWAEQTEMQACKHAVEVPGPSFTVAPEVTAWARLSRWEGAKGFVSTETTNDRDRELECTSSGYMGCLGSCVPKSCAKTVWLQQGLREPSSLYRAWVAARPTISQFFHQKDSLSFPSSSHFLSLATVLLPHFLFPSPPTPKIPGRVSE